MTSPKPPRWRTALLTIHIVASVGALGAALVLLAFGIAGLRGADPRTVYPAAHLVEQWVIAPLAVLALGTGIAQAVLSRFSPVRYWWVAIKLTIVLTAVVILVLEPGLAATAAAETLTDAQRTRVVLFPAVALALLIVNVVLGLSKPDWRLRSSRPT